MFSTEWRTSQRNYDVTIERNVRIPIAGGLTLDSDIFRPRGGGRFPAILAIHPYYKAQQSMEMMPIAFSGERALIEAGDFNFYARRGYAFVVANLRGTQASDGYFGNLDPDPQTIRDADEVIEWIAAQPWCDGSVGMSGISYFSVVQKRVAALKPPHLKAIFAPYGWTDSYRDLYFRGGIMAHGFLNYWIRRYSPEFRIKNFLREQWGDEKYNQAIAEVMNDPDIMAIPGFKQALSNPDQGCHPLLCEILLHPLLDQQGGQYYRERAIDFSGDMTIPAYFGGDWKGYAFHLAGDIRAFEAWKGPKKLTIGPGIYLDRPFYQYAYESLRWFDYWLKGIETGIMDENPVQLFIQNTGQWKSAEKWPVPGTKWTPFYLHSDGLLSEHELWPNEGFSTYEDSPYHRGGLEFNTPPMVESTEICGPIVLNLFGSTTGTDVFWFASLWELRPDGEEELLTRGWLRGSQRKLDTASTRPWQPIHRHAEREPLTPNTIYEFNIEIRPYGILLLPGHRLKLKIRGADDETPKTFIDHLGQGQICRQGTSHVTVYHNAEHPSHLLLPITAGNRIGTFISGGKLPPFSLPR
jgi:predicted acyl esterase